MNAGFGGEGLKCGFVVELKAGAESLEAEGAVHRAGFKVEEAEVAGQMAGNGTFAGSRWPVNRDNNLQAFLGGRKGLSRVLIRASSGSVCVER